MLKNNNRTLSRLTSSIRL